MNPTTIDLTPGSIRGAMGWNSSGSVCSIGNPDGFVSGTRAYIAFLVQNTPGIGGCNTGVGASSTPASGGFYDLWACNLPIPFTSSDITSGNCHLLILGNKTAAGAFLDPHIWHNNHVYASEQCNPTYTNCSSTGAGNWLQWSVDDATVTWGSPA